MATNPGAGVSVIHLMKTEQFTGLGGRRRCDESMPPGPDCDLQWDARSTWSRRAAVWAITTAAWRLRLPEGLLVDSAVLTESLRSAPPSMWSTVVVPPGWCWSAPRPFGCCIGRLAGWSSQRSLYELEPGQWRDYDAYVGHPGRTPDGMHVGTFDQRVDEW